MSKSCGTCQKCCDGTYVGVINGHLMGNGKPCFYLTKDGCGIYEDRPELPCKIFKCLWLEYEDVPDYMKPEVSNVLTDIRSISDGERYMLLENQDDEYPAKVLIYAMNFCKERDMPLVYKYNGSFVFLGDRVKCDKIRLEWQKEKDVFLGMIGSYKQ